MTAVDALTADLVDDAVVALGREIGLTPPPHAVAGVESRAVGLDGLEFTWEQSAAETVDVYRGVLSRES